MMFWKELNPLFLWSVLLNLGNEALKAPCVQQTPAPSSYWGYWFNYALNAHVLPCWVWHCDPTEGGNEVNSAAPAPANMGT